MAVQITGDCAVLSLSAAHTLAYIQHTLCTTFTLLGPHYTNTQGTALSYTTSRCLTDPATRFGASRRNLQGVPSQLSTCLKPFEVLKVDSCDGSP